MSNVALIYVAGCDDVGLNHSFLCGFLSFHCARANTFMSLSNLRVGAAQTPWLRAVASSQRLLIVFITFACSLRPQGECGAY